MTSAQTWSVRIAVRLHRLLLDEQAHAIQLLLSRDRDTVVIDPFHRDLMLTATLTMTDADPGPALLSPVLDSFEAAVLDAGVEIAYWEAVEVSLPQQRTPW
jgi:hypothetical protein